MKVKQAAFMKKHYGQLVGAEIVAFNIEQDGFQTWPVFILEPYRFRQLGKQRLKMTLSKDAEGNGSGFAFIEEAENHNNRDNEPYSPNDREGMRYENYRKT